jgi:hypothetical protein
MDESTNADPSADLTIDVSDLLGVNQAFLADADPELQAALIDAHCNKIGTECC